MLRIECRSQRRLTVGAAPIELGDDSLQALERQIVTNRQHQGQHFGEPVVPVAVGELMLDGGLGDLLDGLAGDRQPPSQGCPFALLGGGARGDGDEFRMA